MKNQSEIDQRKKMEMERMKTYYGICLVKARPMKREEAKKLQGFDGALKKDELGYFVELEKNANRIWMSIEMFEKNFRLFDSDRVDFNYALLLLKSGQKVARDGWNGKGMWIALSPGVKHLESGKFWSDAGRAYAEERGGEADVLPCIIMKTATGEIQMGWLASQTDMLANDWYVVE